MRDVSTASGRGRLTHWKTCAPILDASISVHCELTLLHCVHTQPVAAGFGIDELALMQCFRDSSAALFRHIPMMPYTSYISLCCDKIDTEEEYPEDIYLVVLIRMQCIVCRILTVFPPPDSDGSGITTFSPAAHMAMSTFRADLDALRMQTPKHILDNCTYNR